tara:strand:- start:636 stop:839 length:204 start_codon:yes stop_codon:yes gene_type:complete
MWRLWAKALGQKEGRDEKEADKIAIIRTIIMFQLVVTNMFIISGNVKNLFFDTKYSHCPVQQPSPTP